MARPCICESPPETWAGIAETPEHHYSYRMIALYGELWIRLREFLASLGGHWMLNEPQGWIVGILRSGGEMADEVMPNLLELSTNQQVFALQLTLQGARESSREPYVEIPKSGLLERLTAASAGLEPGEQPSDDQLKQLVIDEEADHLLAGIVGAQTWWASDEPTTWIQLTVLPDVPDDELTDELLERAVLATRHGWNARDSINLADEVDEIRRHLAGPLEVVTIE
jgi:hypothetical protein